MWSWFLGLFQPAASTGALILRLALAIAFSIALLVLLHRFLGPRGRRWLIAFVTFIGGLYLGLEYFLPVRHNVLWPTGIPNPNPDRGANILTPGIEPAGIMLSVVGAFTVGLGIYSLCQVHGRNVARRRPGWHNSFAFFLAMLAMLVFGIWVHYTPAPAAQAESAEQPAPPPGQEAAEPGSIYLNGNVVAGVSAVTRDGQPVVPLRAVVEQAGGTVHWKPEEREAQALIADRRLAVTIDSTQARVDGESRTMGFPAELQNDRTILPAGFLCDALGLSLQYAGEVVRISNLPPPTPPSPPASTWPKSIYELLFSGLFMPLQAATFSLLAFYIASAAYRAFRIHTAEAGLMMAAAFIVMLAQVPVGQWLTHWLPTAGPLAFFRLEALGDWIMSWLNTPAQRGIVFGIAIGGLAMSLRIWLSLERGTFFSEQG
jgi:hypothetical protein